MQNSDVEDGVDEPVKEEARSREIIKGNATNGVQWRTHSHGPHKDSYTLLDLHNQT